MVKYGIVGKRYGWDKDYVSWKISDIIFNEQSDEITEVTIISGGASGVDSFAKIYAMTNGIHYREFLPDVNEESPQRYFTRNKRIAEECDILIAFDGAVGRSGTKNTMRYAREMGKEVILIEKEDGNQEN